MMASSYSRPRLWSTHGLLLALALSSGCHQGKASAAPKPSEQTEIRIEQAKQAERERNYHLARKRYQHAVDEASDPASRALALREMASALIFWGEYPGAMDLFAKSLDNDPTQVQVWHDLGVLQSQSAQDREARHSLERAVELAPHEPRSLIALAALLVKAKDYAGARAHYEVLLRLDIPPRLVRAAREALRILDLEIRRSKASALPRQSEL